MSHKAAALSIRLRDGGRNNTCTNIFAAEHMFNYEENTIDLLYRALLLTLCVMANLAESSSEDNIPQLRGSGDEEEASDGSTCPKI